MSVPATMVPVFSSTLVMSENCWSPAQPVGKKIQRNGLTGPTLATSLAVPEPFNDWLRGLVGDALGVQASHVVR